MAKAKKQRRRRDPRGDRDEELVLLVGAIMKLLAIADCSAADALTVLGTCIAKICQGYPPPQRAALTAGLQEALGQIGGVYRAPTAPTTRTVQ